LEEREEKEAEILRHYTDVLNMAMFHRGTFCFHIQEETYNCFKDGIKISLVFYLIDTIFIIIN